MRILAITNMYPSVAVPTSGVFVEQQVKGLREIGLTIDVLLINRVDHGMKAYWNAGDLIQNQIKESDPDLIHVMYGGVMANRVTKAVRNKPIVVTFHGSDLLGEHLSGLARKWIAYYGIHCSWRAAKAASGVVVVSSRLGNALPPNLDRSKVRVIPCGIDLDRFRPVPKVESRERLGWKSSNYHVLFASNSGNPVKRPQLARSAVNRLCQLGVNAQIHYLSGIPNHEVPLWLSAGDVLLLTSLHEGSPTIIKEALACDLPVVSVDVGDVAERIQGIDGCYLAMPDADDLAAKLAVVCGRSTRIHGRSRVEALSIGRIAGRLKDFYQEVLASFGLAAHR